MMKILPQSFFENPQVGKVLVDGLSCVIHKAFYQVDVQKEGYVSTHAMTLVLNGRLRVASGDEFLTHVDAGQMVFLPKGLYMISDILPSKDAFEAIVFFFDETLIDEFVQSLQIKPAKERSPKQKCVPYLLLDYTDHIRMFTENLLHLYKDKSHSHHKLTRSKLFELLHLISISEQGECFNGALLNLKNKEKRTLKTFMNANFNKSLGVEDYAYLTGRSISTFRRDFKRQFGVAPKQWLIDRRLELAYQLLSQNHTTVTATAMEAGYDDISHFIKAFHKKYGIPPKQFLIQRRNEMLV
ncbi:MAG TPA: AraC family transcriptional regulator [Flavilitoribacter sp.]|nr:AraC family transcriptional regulator [Flavilitoribacter sp.]